VNGWRRMALSLGEIFTDNDRVLGTFDRG